MRGVNSDSITGTGNETEGGGTVGVYLGETPLYADFKMLDINRVEALMGPQGTLYGAGTLAGAVRFVPNRPKLNEYEANVHSRLYGVSSDFNSGNQEDITVNIPLVDGKLALRIRSKHAEIEELKRRVARDPGANPELALRLQELHQLKNQRTSPSA